MRKRVWFRIHSFTGVITGLLLFVICWSGTFAVLGYELDWLVIPAARVTPQAQTASWDEIAEAGIQAMPDAELYRVLAPINARAAAQVWLRPDNDTLHFVWVDPYSAKVTGVMDGRYTVQRFFRDFHRQLFVSRVGLYLVCLFGLTMLLSVVAALFFYRRWWRRFFRFKPGGGRIFWSELHKTSGLWSLWFALIISLTGVWYLFEAARYDFGDGIAAYLGSSDFAAQQIPAPDAGVADAPLTLDELVARVHAEWPELSIRAISLNRPSADSFQAIGQGEFPLVRNAANTVTLDTRTGESLAIQRAGELPPYWIWAHMADPLHFGDFAGLWSKAIWFVFGIVLSGLILTGTYLHAQRLAREAVGSRRYRWPGTGAAMAVSLLVLVAAVPLGIDHVRYYTAGEGIAPPPAGVVAFILGWIVLTLTIIAGWVWLLLQPARWLGQPVAVQPVSLPNQDAS